MEHGIILGSPPDLRHAGLAFWHGPHIQLTNIKIKDIFKDIVQEVSFLIGDSFYVCYNLHLPHDDMLTRQVLKYWKERLAFWKVLVPELEQGDSKSVNLIDLDSSTDTTDKACQRSIFYEGNGREPTFLVLGDFNMEMERNEGIQIQWKRTTVRVLLENILTAMSLQWLSVRVFVDSRSVTRGSKIIDYICVPRIWSQRIHSMSIIERTNSDHSLVLARISIHTARLFPPYWRMKNELLDSKPFVDHMKGFLAAKVTEAPDDPRLFIPWWDNLKITIIEMAKKAWRDGNQKNVKGRSTVNGIPNPGFNKTQPSKILFLQQEDGKIFSDDTQVMGLLTDFYAKLYKSENESQIPPDNMTFGMSRIDPELQQSLQGIITEEELLQAAGQMNIGKAPGHDGITLEFYLKFWPVLGPMILIWCNCICNQGKLSGSAATGIITLVPKKGDLRKIDNWRPISLLTVELKIVLKALAIKLAPAMVSIIPQTQTGLPGSSIFTSLAIIRDVISLSNIQDKPLFILSLDQSKAFDRVSHTFLFHLLKTIGIPLQMIHMIRSLYTGFICRIKNVNVLSDPFPYKRGIRQGDSTSTLLYALAMQPVINMVLMVLHSEGLSLHNDRRIVATAYADDVSFFIRNTESISIILETFKKIAVYSEASLNLDKSAVLALRVPKEREANLVETLKPLQVSFRSLKILGIFFSASLRIEQEQWAMGMSMTKNAIAKHLHSLIQMTYTQRAAWAKRRLWPRWSFLFKVLQPSANQIRQLSGMLSEAVWANGKHWLSVEQISEDKRIGGLEAISPQHRIDTLRIAMLAHLYLEDPEQNTKLLAERILDEYSGVNTGLQILHSKPDLVQLGTLPGVYQAAILAWDKLQICIFPRDLNAVLALPVVRSRFLLQLEDPIDISYKVAKNMNIVTINDLYHKPPERTRWHKNIHANLTAAIDNWVLPPWPDGIMDNPKRDHLLPGPIHFYVIISDYIVGMSKWTNQTIAKALSNHTEFLKNEEVPYESWKRLFAIKAPAAFINQTWKCFHLCIPTPSFYFHCGIRNNLSCVFCSSADISFQHQLWGCEVLSLVISELENYMKLLKLSPLKNYWSFYPLPNDSHRLANFLIVTYYYTVILASRSAANSVSSISSSRLLSIFQHVITRHLKCYAQRYPPSNIALRFKWDIYTHEGIMAFFQNDTLHILDQGVFVPYKRDDTAIL